MALSYDLTVTSLGPDGYTAAIRGPQLGYRVAIIEKYPVLGGTCTNVGCIPTKALLYSSENYHRAIHQFHTHGIQVQGLHLDFDQFMKRKREVVRQNADPLRTASLIYL